MTRGDNIPRRNSGQMVSSIQADRKLLQDNITMRVRYGWAFIALIVSLLMIISIPQTNQIDFQPEDMYLLSVVCFIASIALILMGLFSSHYGSSYRFFTSDGFLNDREQLKIEQELHNKTLYKNQLSSLYSGQSILMAFVGVMVLLVASPVNVLDEIDYVLVIIAMGCTFFAGSFLKKRMYRMYQINNHRLPGRNRASVLGYIMHRCIGRRLSKGVPSKDGAQDGAASGHGRVFNKDPRVREMIYGDTVVAIAFIIQAAIVVINHYMPLDALDVVSMLFFAAIAGFATKHTFMTIMANLDPSKRDYNTVSWNPLYWISLAFRVLIVAVMVVAILAVYVFGLDFAYTLLFSVLILIILAIYGIVLRHFDDYLVVLNMDDLEDRFSVSELWLKGEMVARYVFSPVEKTLVIETDRTLSEHESKVLRFGIEHLLIYPSEYDRVTVVLPSGWNSGVKYYRGRGDLEVDVRFGC